MQRKRVGLGSTRGSIALVATDIAGCQYPAAGSDLRSGQATGAIKLTTDSIVLKAIEPEARTSSPSIWRAMM